MKILKWIGIVLGSLVGLLLLVIVGLAIYGSLRFKPTLADRPLYSITADTSQEGIERGKYLMEEAMDCTDACHTPEAGPALSGTYEEIKEGPISFVFAPPNLTPDIATGLGEWSDAEIARAIREGVDKDNIALIIMPAYNYHALSDADTAAVVGYLRNLAPVANNIPPVSANIVAKIMSALGMMGQDPVGEVIEMKVETPEQGTIENGAYMVALGACSDCHGVDLGGGPIPFSGPEEVPAANLTPSGELPSWDVDAFISAVREGVTPYGKTLSEGMPRYGTSPEDLADIFAFLKTIPAAGGE